MEIARLGRLKAMELGDTKVKVTEAGLARLRNALPKTKIGSPRSPAAEGRELFIFIR
jgi:hypothetical protein